MKYKLLWYLNLFELHNFTNALHTNSRYLEKWKKVGRSFSFQILLTAMINLS